MKKKFLFIFALVVVQLSSSQIIVTTITPEINGSGGLSLDNLGNLYIADFGDFLSVIDPDGQPNHILKLDQNQNLSQYATGFVGASGNDFDSNGVLFQSDIRDNTIYKIIGGVETFVTSDGISAPVGIAFDSTDNFYVCNCGDNTIRKITPSGVSTLFASGTIFSCPNGITIDEDDNLYVSNFGNGDVIKITPAGNTSVITSTPGGTTGAPSNGHLEYYEPGRTLVIASHGSNKIYYLRLDDPSNLEVLAGSGNRGNDDGTALQASFSRPNGVAIAPDGDSIYINSAVPTTNMPNGPLNPQLIRLISGTSSLLLSVPENESPTGTVEISPNPAQHQVTIKFPNAIHNIPIKISIYNTLGQEVCIIYDGIINPENNSLIWTISKNIVKSGLYFVNIESTGQTISKKLIIKK